MAPAGATTVVRVTWSGDAADIPGVLRRQTEIEQLHAGLRDHDVAWLQIAVHDAGAVRRANRVRDLRGIREHLSDRQRSAREALLERLALDQFHHEVADAVRRDADVVERADVRVRELRNRAGLALQAIAQRVAVDCGCGVRGP